MLPPNVTLLFFHRRRTAILFRMRFVKHACYTNMNEHIKKENQIFKNLFTTVFFNSLFIQEHMLPRAKTRSPHAGI